ncbi:hypothetical protein GCM10007888_17810 [Methylobacterium oxalidis]|uniref:Uncharacterized protein n=1 Tax=Methylobacterium oxalidis TaxID=944322 RepID=A0ABQ6DF55_9HYPH|nr:hypothetical protein LDDCCGHA_3261 [Methylobacterium oxalidis]GLS63400.1 hypothetical protein GCM10007888_17810 [Methylobacterium oxalidis]
MASAATVPETAEEPIRVLSASIEARFVAETVTLPPVEVTLAAGWAGAAAASVAAPI